MEGNTALLVVDVQVAMFSYEDEKLYRGNEVLDNICLLLEKARSSKTPVFFVQHTSDDDEFAEGVDTWQIHPRIKPLETETVVQKRTWDSFHETTLQAELQGQGIKRLVIAGLQSEFCLDTTCRRAFSLGYKNILVKDAHSTFDSTVLMARQIIDHHNNVLGGRFVQLKSTDEIVF